MGLADRVSRLERGTPGRGRCLCGGSLTITAATWAADGLFVYRDGPAAEVRAAVARRLGIAWPPPKCPLCGRPDGDWRATLDRIWAAATADERRALVE